MLLVPRLVRIVSSTFITFYTNLKVIPLFLECQAQLSVINGSSYILDMQYKDLKYLLKVLTILDNIIQTLSHGNFNCPGLNKRSFSNMPDASECKQHMKGK